MTPKFQWLKTTNHALKKINLFSYSSGSFNVQAVGESGVSVIYERVKLYPACKSVGENTD